MQRLRTIIFPIDFNGFLRFRESMLGGKIDLGVSWRPLGASWRPLEASYGHLMAILEASQGVFEASGGGFEAPRNAQEELLEARTGKPGADFRSLN